MIAEVKLNNDGEGISVIDNPEKNEITIIFEGTTNILTVKMNVIAAKKLWDKLREPLLE